MKRREENLNVSTGGLPLYDCYCDNCAPRVTDRMHIKCATCDGLSGMAQHHLAGGDCGEMPEFIGYGVLTGIVFRETYPHLAEK